MDKSSRPLRYRGTLMEKTMENFFAAEAFDRGGDSDLIRLVRGLSFMSCANLAAFELLLGGKASGVTLPVRKAWQMLHLNIKHLGRIDGVGHRKAGTRQV